jgi:hypothetical protein
MAGGARRGERVAIGATAMAVIVAGAVAAVTMSGSSGTPAPVRQVADLRPTHTAKPSRVAKPSHVARSPRATRKPKPAHTATPTPSPSPTPATEAPQPAPTPAAPATTGPAATQPATPAPTSTYQQDCYAPPHPTCTVPPRPSWMPGHTYPAQLPTGEDTSTARIGATG